MKCSVYLSALTVALAAAGGAAAQQLREHATLAGHEEGTSCLAFSPDGKTLASGSRGYDRKTNSRWGELKLWDVTSGKESASLRGHGDGISAVAFGPDNKALATAGYDDVILWDLPAGKPRLTLKMDDHSLRILAFSADGRLVGCVGYHGAKLWEAAGGQERAAFKGLEGSGFPAFGPDLKTLAAPSHQDVDLWDLTTGKPRLTLEDHRGAANRVRFSGDGKTVVVASTRLLDDRTHRSEVRFWDAASVKLLRTLRPDVNVISGLSLRPDGKLLAVSGGKDYQQEFDVVLLDPETGREFARATQKASSGGTVFSPDGRFLAASVGKEIKLWEVLPPDR